MNVEKSRGTHGSVYRDSCDALIKASPKHRNSLENDVRLKTYAYISFSRINCENSEALSLVASEDKFL